jgi:hypothetical protein
MTMAFSNCNSLSGSMQQSHPEKLTGSPPVNKFPHFMEPEGSLPYPQLPATCPYPEPARSNPCSKSYFLKIHLNNILPSRNVGVSGQTFWTHVPTVRHRPTTRTGDERRHAHSPCFVSISLICRYVLTSNSGHVLHFLSLSSGGNTSQTF